MSEPLKRTAAATAARTLPYADPSVRPPPPTFRISPKVAEAAALVSCLLGVIAFLMMHDHLVVRSYHPTWRQWTAPIALLLAALGCAVALWPTTDRKEQFGVVAMWATVLFTMVNAGYIALGSRGVVCGESGERVKCAANLRQIGQAMYIYASANNGAYPPDLATLLLQTELARDAMVCPDTNASAPDAFTHAALAQQFASSAHCSYVYCGAGQRSSVDENVVLAYEPLANHSNDGMNVLFGDGRVEFVSGAAAASILAQTAKGVRPPRLGPTTLPAATTAATAGSPASALQPTTIPLR